MSTAMLISLTLIAGLCVGGLEWALRIERRAARRARDAGRVGWTVTTDPPPYDWAHDPLTPAELAAWAEFEREERS